MRAAARQPVMQNEAAACQFKGTRRHRLLCHESDAKESLNSARGRLSCCGEQRTEFASAMAGPSAPGPASMGTAQTSGGGGKNIFSQQEAKNYTQKISNGQTKTPSNYYR